MRVLLDTTIAARAPLSGTAIYLERLQNALARVDDVEIVPVVNAARPPPAGGGPGSLRNFLIDRKWTALELPRLARSTGAALVHHPLPARARTDLPQIVTVHDLAFELLPESFDRAYRSFAHRSHRAAARSASAVVCVSETTAQDARAIWGVAAERIVVALHGPGQEPGKALRGPARRTPRHFLYVGDNEPRKNLAMLLEAYAMLRESLGGAAIELVLAGSASARAPGVRVEHRPSSARLAELYRDAAGLVHPALYEGFGLTVLEAMSAGVPVLAAHSPAVLEVCVDAALYADPRDPRSFADAMARILRDSQLREEMARRGLRRAGDFSWSASARAHADAYSLAVER